MRLLELLGFRRFVGLPTRRRRINKRRITRLVRVPRHKFTRAAAKKQKWVRRRINPMSLWGNWAKMVPCDAKRRQNFLREREELDRKVVQAHELAQRLITEHKQRIVHSDSKTVDGAPNKHARVESDCECLSTKRRIFRPSTIAQLRERSSVTAQKDKFCESDFNASKNRSPPLNVEETARKAGFGEGRMSALTPVFKQIQVEIAKRQPRWVSIPALENFLLPCKQKLQPNELNLLIKYLPFGFETETVYTIENCWETRVRATKEAASVSLEMALKRMVKDEDESCDSAKSSPNRAETSPGSVKKPPEIFEKENLLPNNWRAGAEKSVPKSSGKSGVLNEVAVQNNEKIKKMFAVHTSNSLEKELVERLKARSVMATRRQELAAGVQSPAMVRRVLDSMLHAFMRRNVKVIYRHTLISELTRVLPSLSDTEIITVINFLTANCAEHLNQSQRRNGYIVRLSNLRDRQAIVSKIDSLVA